MKTDCRTRVTVCGTIIFVLFDRQY